MAEFDVTFKLNGQEIQAQKGESILGAALRVGMHIPHFCYHKNLSVVGQCRACLVDIVDAGNGKPIPKLQPSCATPVADGMVVESENERVEGAQEGVFEFLLKNHPLDCPVCDQGGECPLQDQSMAYAKAVSRTHEIRRIYPRKELSPYIKPEMNRCVHCTRCIRFTKEIDGGGEFGWAHRGDKTEVGIFEDLPVTSIVSGNVIDICPVGALTDNKYRFTARVWEMKHVEGPCTLCSVGCRQRVWTMFDHLKRVTAGENEEVNDTWICDVGRWGWSGAHSENRILKPMVRKNGQLQEVEWKEAIAVVANRLGEIRENHGGAALAGLGGAQSTNESAYQFGVFFRSVLGSNNIDCRIHPRDIHQTETQYSSYGAIGGMGTIGAIGKAKAVLLLGSDPFEEHPILALQIRKAHRTGANVVSLHPRRIDLRILGRLYHLNSLPGEEARALRALAKAIIDVGASPDGEGAESYLGTLAGTSSDTLCESAGLDRESVSEAAKALRPEDGSVAVVVGPGIQDEATATEAVNIALLLNANLVFASTSFNMQGALDMGLHPGLLPGGRPLSDAEARNACYKTWGKPIAEEPGMETGGILSAAVNEKVRGLFLFCCDPVAEHSDGDFARKALESAEFVVLQTSHKNASLEYADVVFPALSLYEEEGTVTNLERRVQRLRRAMRPVAGKNGKESWQVFGDIALAMGHPMKAHVLNAIQISMRAIVLDYSKAFGRISEAGLLLTRVGKGAYRASELPPVSPISDGLQLILAPLLWLSGAYAASAYHLSDKPPVALRLSPPDIERIGVLDGDEIELMLADYTIRIPARSDETLPIGLALAPEGFLGTLGDALLNRGGEAGARGVSIRVTAIPKEAVSA